MSYFGPTASCFRSCCSGPVVGARRRALSGLLSVALPAGDGAQGEQVERPRPAGTGRLRNILVVGQFAISIGLIICTMIVYSQTVFAQTTDLGFEREGLIQVDNMTRRRGHPADRDADASRSAGSTGSNRSPRSNMRVANQQTLNTNVRVPGRTEPVLLGWYSAHPGFLPRPWGCGCWPAALCRATSPTTMPSRP